MAEEKMCHHHGGWLFLLGVLAIVYGVVQYLLVALVWPVYTAWIVGGIILLLVHWAKHR
jgi:hypothetical protein